ncbi:uncharacterized protein YER152C-like [Anneissia japonica]|uniref:uncharacterized protein YER152C-like n=1 Tax=Anneissia japonica TaxID=1529436 RepID=UPI001425B60F|nr:uncharacterized protein YER152C-like [Anneissia japonica]XP_033103363.1 uncharacterized protein YER152C-like [Anneissia japonica]
MSNGIKFQDKDYGMHNNLFTEEHMLADGKYGLDVGGPGVGMLRSAAKFMMKATEMRLEKEISGEGDLLQYGSTLGDPAYRINLAKFLSEQFDDIVDSKSLMTTTGATAGLSLLASTFFNVEDYIFIEDPTYFHVNKLVAVDLGLKAVPIPIVEDGLDLEMLEEELERRKPVDFQPTTERPFWALVYVVSVYQNPTGLCYSKEKCEKLVNLAREYNLLVVSDDVYNLLCLEKDGDAFKRAPPRLYQYDVKSDNDYFGNIVSNGSFSKILGPGLRLGWIEAPKVVLSKLMVDGVLLGGGSMNHFTSGIVGSSLNTDLFSAFLLMVRTTLKRKLNAVLDVLQKHCPKSVKYSVPKGGYFIWIELPSYVDVHELSEFCQKIHNVSILEGKRCSVAGNCQSFLRICFAYYSVQENCIAVKKLLGAMESRLKRAANINGALQ